MSTAYYGGRGRIGIVRPVAYVSFVEAVLCLLAGLAGALMSIPSDTSPSGALRTPSVLFVTGVLGPFLICVVRGGIQNAFRAEWAVLASIVYFIFLDTIQGLYVMAVSREAVTNLFIGTTLFEIGFFVALSRTPARLPRLLLQVATGQFSNKLLTKAIWLCFFLGMFYYLFMSDFSIVTAIDGLLNPRWSAPWSRGSIGNWYSFLEHFVYFGYLLPTLTVVLAVQEGRWLKANVITGFLLSTIYLPFIMQGGGRRILGVCVGAALLTYLCLMRKDLRGKHLAGLLVSVVLLLVVMDLMLENRNRGAVEFSYSLDQFQSVRIDDNFLRFAQIMEIFPVYHPHVGFSWVVYTLSRPVPRVFWPNKPLDPGFSLPDYLGAQGVSYSSSSLSEWYMAFGWVGLLAGGFIYGFLANCWSQLLDDSVPATGLAMYGMGLMALVLSVRSMFEMILMSYPLLGWIALNRVVLFRQKR